MKKSRIITQSILFLATGVATGVQVMRAVLMSVWGAPTFAIEGISLIGSALLTVAGVVSFSAPRRGVRMAAIGLIVVWCMYGPVAAYGVWHHFTGRALQLVFYGRLPGNSALRVNGFLPAGPQWTIRPDEMDQLRAMGFNGELRWNGGMLIDQGKPDRLLVIVDHGLEKSVDLREPYKSNVIYIQRGQEWVMIPPEARTRDRILQLKPDPDHPGALLFQAQGDMGSQGAAAYVNFFSKERR